MRLRWQPPALKTTAVLAEFALEAKIAALEDAVLSRATVPLGGKRVVSVLKLAADPKNEEIHKAMGLLRKARGCVSVADAEKVMPLLDMALAELSR